MKGAKIDWVHSRPNTSSMPIGGTAAWKPGNPLARIFYAFRTPSTIYSVGAEEKEAFWSSDRYRSDETRMVSDFVTYSNDRGILRQHCVPNPDR